MGTSRLIGKMYAHISWANKEFSKTYVNLLGQFIQDADYLEIRKKFKIPLLQVLVLEDNESIVQLRAKIAMKYLFSQIFMSSKNKFYVLALEMVHLLFYLITNVK